MTTPLFWLTDLDLAVARSFYRPGFPAGPFPEGNREVWRLFRAAVPFLAWGLSVGSAGVTAAGCFLKRFRKWRLHALSVLLTVALGPGLIINGILKPHFGRPRPRQTIMFGGEFEYLPVLVPGPNENCRSFAGGDSSMGFAFLIFYFMYRRRRRAIARGWLALSIVLGMTIGLGRMAAGAHFLSDILWSGYICYLVALATYYFALRIPTRENCRSASVPNSPRPSSFN